MAPRKMPKPNAGATSSLTTLKEMELLQKVYPQYRFRIPERAELAVHFKEGELCFFLESFKKGMELPIPDYLTEFFNYFKLVPAQFTPNVFSILKAINRFFKEWSIEWSAPNVLSLITFNKLGGCYYYAVPRRSDEFAIEGSSSSNHGWRSDFVFAKSMGSWGISTIPRTDYDKIFDRSEITEDVGVLYANLKSSFFSLNVKDYSYSVVNPRRKPLVLKDASVGEKKEAVVKNEKNAEKRRRLTGVPEAGEVEASAAGVDDDLAHYLEGEDEVAEEGDDVQPPLRRRQPYRAAKGLVQVQISDDEEEGAVCPFRLTYKEGSGEAGVFQGPERTLFLTGGEEAGKETEATHEPTATRGPDGADTEPGCSSRRKDGEEVYGTEDCWWDLNAGNCTFRFNEKIRLVPEQEVCQKPLLLLGPMTTKEDRAYLRTLSDGDLMRLQSQMSMGSSVVAKFIFDQSRKRKRSAEAKDRSNNNLRDYCLKLEKELDQVKTSLASSQEAVELSKNKLAIAESGLETRLAGEEAKAKLAAITIDNLSAEIIDLKRSHEAEKVIQEKERQVYEKTIKALQFTQKRPTADTVVISDAAEEAVQKFKASDDYLTEMSEFGDYGFQLLKKFLLKEGHIDQATLDQFQYSDCIDKDAEDN